MSIPAWLQELKDAENSYELRLALVIENATRLIRIAEVAAELVASDFSVKNPHRYDKLEAALRGDEGEGKGKP